MQRKDGLNDNPYIHAPSKGTQSRHDVLIVATVLEITTAKCY
jgi:hypothetical protein